MARSNNILDPRRQQGVYFIKRKTGNCTVWSAAIWNPNHAGGRWLWDGPLSYGDSAIDPMSIVEVTEDELCSLAGVPFGIQSR